jgi:hypothetical protein
MKSEESPYAGEKTTRFSNFLFTNRRNFIFLIIFAHIISIIMNIPTKFKEYIWLVNTIRKARRITFAEINERWLETEMSGGVDLPRTWATKCKCYRQTGWQMKYVNGIMMPCV